MRATRLRRFCSIGARLSISSRAARAEARFVCRCAPAIVRDAAKVSPERAMLNAKSGPRIRHQAPEGAPYETLTLDKLTPVIGAEIGGIDLSRPLSDSQRDEIH